MAIRGGGWGETYTNFLGPSYLLHCVPPKPSTPRPCMHVLGARRGGGGGDIFRAPARKTFSMLVIVFGQGEGAKEKSTAFLLHCQMPTQVLKFTSEFLSKRLEFRVRLSPSNFSDQLTKSPTLWSLRNV